MNLEQLQNATLENIWRQVLESLVVNPSYSVNQDENKTWYENIVMENKPELDQFDEEFEEVKALLIYKEEARLALIAKKQSIIERLAAIGGIMTDKHKSFSGLSEELNACGHAGNHAKIVWDWYLSGDDSHLDALEAKHAELESVRLANEYKEKRKAEYPSMGDQLDMIYHNLNDWRAEIKKIKDKYPKPE